MGWTTMGIQVGPVDAMVRWDDDDNEGKKDARGVWATGEGRCCLNLAMASVGTQCTIFRLNMTKHSRWICPRWLGLGWLGRLGSGWLGISGWLGRLRTAGHRLGESTKFDGEQAQLGCLVRSCGVRPTMFSGQVKP
jgi:hypothetical protein